MSNRLLSMINHEDMDDDDDDDDNDDGDISCNDYHRDYVNYGGYQ